MYLFPRAMSLALATKTAGASCLDFYYSYFLKESHIKILAHSNSVQVNCSHAVCGGHKHHRDTHDVHRKE